MTKQGDRENTTKRAIQHSNRPTKNGNRQKAKTDMTRQRKRQVSNRYNLTAEQDNRRTIKPNRHQNTITDRQKKQRTNSNADQTE